MARSDTDRRFLELEGSPAWSIRTGLRPRLFPDDYITASYGALYLARCQAGASSPATCVASRVSGL